MKLIDELIRQMPELPDWQRQVRVGHIYKDVLLKFCEVHKVKSLEEALSSSSGHLICSNEVLEPCPGIYDDKLKRVTSIWRARSTSTQQVRFEYTVDLVTSDTLRSRLHDGSLVSIVALFSHTDGADLVFEPLLIGFPWVESDDPTWAEKAVYLGKEFFENFIEDFDEFKQVTTLSRPESIEPLRDISEWGVKRALCTILGDEPKLDWSGENSDHFTDHLHLSGQRVSGAFVLKGPSRFSPMGLNHLGKNNNQIVRLSHEPANVLFVQHCHEILPDVRSTLRAFSVQPSRARRYCLIDGWDTLRLLQAYNLLGAARDWSREKKPQRLKMDDN